MVITKITAQHIFAYVDETFVIFDRDKLIIGADIVGTAWPAGKTKKGQTSQHIPASDFGYKCCYTEMLVSELIKRAEKA